MGTDMLRRLGTIGLLAVASLLLANSPALGATITPNTFADENGGGSECSLREAIQAADNDAPFGGCSAGSSGGDTIPLAAGTYSLSIPPDGTNDDNLDGDLDIDSNVTITHTGLAPAAINGGGVDRVINVLLNSTLTASGLTIANGLVGGSGGGILNSNGTLNLSSATVTNNETTGSFGGGIANAGGAAVANLTNVTLSGNRAVTDSGGFDNAAATANLNSVTISGNTADSDQNLGGTAGGIYELSGTVNLRNTIVAGNTDNSPGPGNAPDCDGTPTSEGNNLIGDLTQCEFTATGGDKTNANPLLGPLADNGGSTFTHALLAGSPAIDGAGPGAPPTDQRGAPRSSDIGAYELVSCGAVVVNRVGTSGNDSVSGTAGADGFLLFAGNDGATGLGGADAVCGGDGKDTLKGGPGKDLLRGERGRDKLKGGGGKDKLVGGPGRDLLVGGKGKDRCKGGGGRDTERAC